MPGERTPRKVPMMPARRHRGLEHVRLEPLVEQVDRAHGHELERGCAGRCATGAGSAGPCATRRAKPGTSKRHRVRRHHGEDRLDEARHVRHRLRVLVVGLGVERASGGRSRGASARGRSCARGSRRSASGVKVPSRGRISRPWRGRSSSRMISGRSSETTYEQTENLKPGKTSSVTAAPPRTWRRSRTSTFLPGAGQVGGADEAVVAAADDDRVVASRHQAGHSIVLCGERQDARWPDPLRARTKEEEEPRQGRGRQAARDLPRAARGGREDLARRADLVRGQGQGVRDARRPPPRRAAPVGLAARGPRRAGDADRVRSRALLPAALRRSERLGRRRARHQARLGRGRPGSSSRPFVSSRTSASWRCCPRGTRRSRILAAMPIGTPFHPRTSALCESMSWREWAGYFAVSQYEATTSASTTRSATRRR